MIRLVCLYLSLLFALNGCAAFSVRNTDEGAMTFSLYKPRAAHVQFLSSLDGFKIHETHRNAVGFWEYQLPTDATFSYFYQVDGSLYLPDCPFKEFDDFGTQNCIYVP